MIKLPRQADILSAASDTRDCRHLGRVGMRRYCHTGPSHMVHTAVLHCQNSSGESEWEGTHAGRSGGGAPQDDGGTVDQKLRAPADQLGERAAAIHLPPVRRRGALLQTPCMQCLELCEGANEQSHCVPDRYCSACFPSPARPPPGRTPPAALQAVFGSVHVV